MENKMSNLNWGIKDIDRRTFLYSRLGSILGGAVLGGAFLKQSEANAASRIAVPSASWRQGARVVASVGRRAISAEAIAWRSDSQRVAWRCSNGPGYIFDVNSGAYGASLPAPQNSATTTGILWLQDSNTLLLGGAPLGTPPFSPISLMVVNGENGEIIRIVEGAIPPHQARDPSAIAPNFPLSPLANCAQQIFQTAPTRDIVVRPFGGLRGFEIFNSVNWSAQIEKMDDLGGRFCDLRPRSMDAVFSFGRGMFFVIDRLSGRTLHRVYAHRADISAVKYSPNGKTLLASMLWIGNGRNDQTNFDSKEADRHKIKSWRADDCSFVGQIDAEMSECRAIDFHPDSDIFAVATDREVLFFDSNTLTLLARSICPIEMMVAISFSPDGSWLAVSGTSGVVCLMRP
jgi:WD40 repeat protein